MRRVVVFVVFAVGCACACSRTELDMGDATPPGFIPCGNTVCLASQYCVVPCTGDECSVRVSDAGTCPSGYDQWAYCCAPIPPAPYCVDDPHHLPPPGCFKGTPDYFQLDQHVVSCMCTV